MEANKNNASERLWTQQSPRKEQRAEEGGAGQRVEISAEERRRLELEQQLHAIQSKAAHVERLIQKQQRLVDAQESKLFAGETGALLPRHQEQPERSRVESLAVCQNQNQSAPGPSPAAAGGGGLSGFCSFETAPSSQDPVNAASLRRSGFPSRSSHQQTTSRGRNPSVERRRQSCGLQSRNLARSVPPPKTAPVDGFHACRGVGEKAWLSTLRPDAHSQVYIQAAVAAASARTSLAANERRRRKTAPTEGPSATATTTTPRRQETIAAAAAASGGVAACLPCLPPPAPEGAEAGAAQEQQEPMREEPSAAEASATRALLLRFRQDQTKQQRALEECGLQMRQLARQQKMQMAALERQREGIEALLRRQRREYQAFAEEEQQREALRRHREERQAVFERRVLEQRDATQRPGGASSSTEETSSSLPALRPSEAASSCALDCIIASSSPAPLQRGRGRAAPLPSAFLPGRGCCCAAADARSATTWSSSASASQSAPTFARAPTAASSAETSSLSSASLTQTSKTATRALAAASRPPPPSDGGFPRRPFFSNRPGDGGEGLVNEREDFRWNGGGGRTGGVFQEDLSAAFSRSQQSPQSEGAQAAARAAERSLSLTRLTIASEEEEEAAAAAAAKALHKQAVSSSSILNGNNKLQSSDRVAFSCGPSSTDFPKCGDFPFLSSSLRLARDCTAAPTGTAAAAVRRDEETLDSPCVAKGARGGLSERGEVASPVRRGGAKKLVSCVLDSMAKQLRLSPHQQPHQHQHQQQQPHPQYAPPQGVDDAGLVGGSGSPHAAATTGVETLDSFFTSAVASLSLSSPGSEGSPLSPAFRGAAAAAQATADAAQSVFEEETKKQKALLRAGAAGAGAGAAAVEEDECLSIMTIPSAARREECSMSVSSAFLEPDESEASSSAALLQGVREEIQKAAALQTASSCKNDDNNASKHNKGKASSPATQRQPRAVAFEVLL